MLEFLQPLIAAGFLLMGVGTALRIFVGTAK